VRSGNISLADSSSRSHICAVLMRSARPTVETMSLFASALQAKEYSNCYAQFEDSVALFVEHELEAYAEADSTVESDLLSRSGRILRRILVKTFHSCLMRSSEQELTIDTRMLLHATFQISSSEVIQWLIASLLSLWQVFTKILLVGPKHNRAGGLIPAILPQRYPSDSSLIPAPWPKVCHSYSLTSASSANGSLNP